ncbi:RES family NAD+ phosphorylase [Rhizobium leguminosarum]|uniref:RES family NAD+ phosphorylase n=1 Tax=Rhizobium leguminosarum TaxID=384 RepID=UPI001C90C0B8|nr:RES family NAD+ phosphorylase [Rhizobium leguminosarum]MBY2942808.1 RES family NAD+ phosphorylase [Rhizobium leguminosarum]
MYEELQNKNLCTDCVGESYLSALIADQGKIRKCHYCGERAKTFKIAAICDQVDGAFQRHFTRARMEMNGYEWAMYKDPESSFEFEPDGDQTVYAIMGAANIAEEIATDIQQILEDRYSDFESAQIGETTEYDSELHYEELQPDDREWQETWRAFERSLKTEARFFSARAIEVLNSIFDGIDLMETRGGASLIVEGGPGTPHEHLYRARAFQSPGKLQSALLRPDKELGPPPSRFAASGRMNAPGISVFYGATDPETAVAEVRPPVGSEVAIGRFQVIRALRLLDLTALSGVIAAGSVFDPEYANTLSRMMFLRSLSRRMARPIMPDDQEFDYLPTQAVADFLATETVTPLDGIIFPSVQVAGGKQNVVLFHKASLVAKLVIPEGADVEVETHRQNDDGWHRDYTVYWRLAVEKEKGSTPEVNRDPLAGLWEPPSASEDDMDFGSGRIETLRIMPTDLEVRIINAVSFESEDYKVDHVKYKRQAEPDF